MSEKKTKQSTILIKELTLDIGEGLAPAMKQATGAMDKFGSTIYKIAENEYLKHHAKLPGGTSTARLRKKRKTVVMKWLCKNPANPQN